MYNLIVWFFVLLKCRKSKQIKKFFNTLLSSGITDPLLPILKTYTYLKIVPIK